MRVNSDLGPISADGGHDILSIQLKVASQRYTKWSKAKAIQSSQPKFTVARLSKTNNKTNPCARQRPETAYTSDGGCCMNAHQQTRRTFLWGYRRLFSLWNENRQIVSTTACAQIRLGCKSVVFANNSLCNPSGLWHIAPKHHHLLEFVERAFDTKVNPSFHWCCADEHFVGTIARIGRKCHARSMSQSTLTRFLLRGRLMVQHSERERERAIARAREKER